MTIARRASREEPLAIGDVLAAETPLERVEIDVAAGRIALELSGARFVLEGLRAATLLGPWDGAAGIVESLRVVAVDAEEICLELRVRFGTIPRVYRAVAARLKRE